VKQAQPTDPASSQPSKSEQRRRRKRERKRAAKAAAQAAPEAGSSSAPRPSAANGGAPVADKTPAVDGREEALRRKRQRKRARKAEAKARQATGAAGVEQADGRGTAAGTGKAGGGAPTAETTPPVVSREEALRRKRQRKRAEKTEAKRVEKSEAKTTPQETDKGAAGAERGEPTKPDGRRALLGAGSAVGSLRGRLSAGRAQASTALSTGSRRWLAPAAVIVVVAGVAGLLVGRSTGGEQAPASADEAPAVAPAPADDGLAEYASTLDREVAALDAERAAGVEELADANTRREQAAATEDLAAAHRRAARSLQSASAPPELQQANESVIRVLGRVASAYGALAAAADAQDPAAYEAGQAAVRRTEARLQQRLARIESP